VGTQIPVGGLAALERVADKNLPRSTPEAEHVSSVGILNFIEAAVASAHELHSVMIARHGRVVAEGWWAPYRSEAPHQLYSLGKIWISTAAGLAIAEGKLDLDAPVIEVFAGDLPAQPSEHLKAMRIRDLLRGGTGHSADAIRTFRGDEQFVRSFMALPVPYPPGTHFVYNPPASVMVSLIVEKVTGERLSDYLRPRLFQPLNIEGPVFEVGAASYPAAARTEDLAKLGLLYLQKGIWQGKQVIPASWVNTATASQISTTNWAGGSPGAEWMQGYGYQFWRCRHNIYRGDGAFGQFCIVLPEHDAVVVITSESRNLQNILDLVWEHLLTAFDSEDGKASAGSQSRLRQKLNSLMLPCPSGARASPISRRIDGKRFVLDTNGTGIDGVSFSFQDDACLFRLHRAVVADHVNCGYGKWRDNAVCMPIAPPGLGLYGAHPESRPPTKVSAAYAWKDESTLEMQWRYNELAHRHTATCRFTGDRVRVEFRTSVAQLAVPSQEPSPVFTGMLAA
jgi:CubicO group peptidase (beta-lactamase class C family)